MFCFLMKKTLLNEMKTQTFDGEKSEYISYSKQTKSMIFYLFRSNTLSICDVCNVPEQINDWTIPLTGVVISFYADEFEACYSPPSIGFTQSYGCFVLTSLKRKIE